MKQLQHRYITVSYKLYADNEAGIHEILEEAPAAHPYQFITNLGMTLDSFESKVADLNAGDAFDFTLSVDEAYGPYEQDRVVEVPKTVFHVDGRFDKENIYPGNVIPLVNADGNHFYGLVAEIKEESVVIDLNSLYAGKELHYVGRVETAREATLQEIQGAMNMLAGEEDGCSSCGDHGCGGGCGSGCGDHDHGCGCGGHDDHECCSSKGEGQGSCACMG